MAHIFVLLDSLGRFQEDPESHFLRVERLELIRYFVSQLPPFYGLLFCLKFKEELSTESLSEILGVSHNYVNVMVHKLRKDIKKFLSTLESDNGKEA
jgi:RNA polymerase sigma factor (sigma-70 family)